MVQKNKPLGWWVYDIESYPWETRDEADQLVYRMQARAAIALINSKQR